MEEANIGVGEAQAAAAAAAAATTRGGGDGARDIPRLIPVKSFRNDLLNMAVSKAVLLVCVINCLGVFLIISLMCLSVFP
jgi:hypothetical protein